MILGWLAVILILRVLAAILANYPDYFPPNFDSLFLQGREATFTGAYPAAFYVHIFSGPVVLFNGLILLSDYIRRRHRAWHRWLGRVQVVVLLVFVVPSSVVMARHAFGGWAAGLSFLLLSAATALCAIVGVVHARGHRYDQHRLWMLRSYCLICSAVTLRLISGTAGLVGVSSPEHAYILAAWSSWLFPLAAFEIAERLPKASLVAGLLAALVGAGFVVAMLTPTPRGVTKANFDRIEIGLTRVEVDDILGRCSPFPVATSIVPWVDGAPISYVRWIGGDGQAILGFAGSQVYEKRWTATPKSWSE